MKKLIILLSLIVIVLISGCANQTIQTGKAKGGIVITSFYFDSPTIYAGDVVGLNLEVQNVGGKPGILRRVRIYGGWNVDKELDLNEADKNLSPAEPTDNIKGESRYLRLRLESPININVSTKYDFGARVEYDYTTDYVGIIRVVTENYLESLPTKDREALLASGGIVSSSYTDGPLTISSESSRSFVFSGGSVTRSIKFKIINVGGGYPYDSYLGDYSVRIKSVESSGNTVYNCRGFDETNPEKIRLSKGESSIFTCDFTPSQNFINKIDIPFKITFSYSYYVDGVTTITVEPK